MDSLEPGRNLNAQIGQALVYANAEDSTERPKVSKQEYAELVELASELATKNTQLAAIVHS